jgi:putrescine---pyruvate transaminase
MAATAFLHPFAAPAATDFITITQGQGAVVSDADGNRYVDAMASLWYCNVGHGRAEIVDAVASQMRRLAAFHTFEKFTNEPAEELAAAVAAIAPMAGARVFLTSSGSEAVDTAVKIARFAHAVAGRPERTVIVSRAPSYHGVTYGGVSATGLPANQEHFGPLVPDVLPVPKDDLEAVAQVFAARPGQVAAVIAEPVVGAGGVHPPAPGYLEGLRRLCDEHGAWLILDEVICGFGRLGHWWGAERYGVRPDLVTFAKAVTSGYQPLGGVVVGPAVLAPLCADPGRVLRHGHTYSGHPAACVAGLQALRITREEGLLDRVGKIAQRLSSGLESLLADGLIAGVRGEGGMWAAALHPGMPAPAVRDAMLAHGVIARPIGDATVVFCPPLVIDDPQLDQCVEALEAGLRSVGREAPRG